MEDSSSFFGTTSKVDFCCLDWWIGFSKELVA